MPTRPKAAAGLLAALVAAVAGVAQPPKAAPATQFDQDAGTWVLREGGQVVISPNVKVDKLDKLPNGGFWLHHAITADTAPVGDEVLAMLGRPTKMTLLAVGRAEFTADGMKAFAKSSAGKSLTHLELTFPKPPDKSLLTGILKHAADLPEVHTLHLGNVHLTAAHAQQIASFPKVSSLTLTRATFEKAAGKSPGGAGGLASGKPGSGGLASLRVYDPGPGAETGGWAYLTACTKLATLSLSGPEVTDKVLAQLPGPRSLHTLSLTSTGVTDAGLKHLARCPNLITLHAEQNAQITGSGFADCKKVVTLARVHLNRTKVTDGGLAGLAALPSLRQLTLTRTPVTDAGMKHLAKCGQLETLHLGGTKVGEAAAGGKAGNGPPAGKAGDGGLAALARAPALRTLHLSDAAVTDLALPDLVKSKTLAALFLDGTKVTDDGAKHLVAIPTLEALYLGQTKVTDDTLAALSAGKTAAPKLAVLAVQATRVTPAGVRRFEAARPKVEVTSSYPAK